MADQEIFEAKISTTSFPPRLPGNKLALRYKVKSSDLNQTTTWSPIYYIDGPTRLQATTNSIDNLTASKFVVDWVDDNASSYDLFVSYSIDLSSYTGTVNSVGTTKTIFFTSGFIPEELKNFEVGDLIDVAGVANALNGTATEGGADMKITELNLTTSPYYIRYIGDSSNTTANTAISTGYFATANLASPEQRSRQYRYLSTYPLTGEGEKTYTFQSAINQTGTLRYGTAAVIIQLEGTKKVLDTSLEIAKTARVAL
jgi:hypothetical protein